MSRLKYEIVKLPDFTHLKITGQIDETFPLELSQIEIVGILRIDLQGLTSINSLGIREWIRFFSKIENHPIELLNCPKIFIDQVNMVQGFINQKDIVKSFYVPYFNDQEKLEKNILFSYGKEYGTTPLNAHDFIIDEKGRRLEIDVVESKYFKFLKTI